MGRDSRFSISVWLAISIACVLTRLNMENEMKHFIEAVRMCALSLLCRWFSAYLRVQYHFLIGILEAKTLMWRAFRSVKS